MSAVGTTHHRRTAELTTYRKCLLGGLGALSPILINLLVVDYKSTLSNLTSIVLLGYATRVVVLFSVGAIVVFLHRTERNPMRVFELGIVAPALITAVINGANASHPGGSVTSAIQRSSTMSVAAHLTVPTVYTQSKGDEAVKRYARPKETSTEQLWRGLTGAQSERVWFVVVGFYRNLEDARRQVQQITQATSEFTPEIYQDDESYEVVISANVTLDDAKRIKQKAVDAKLPAVTAITLKNPWATK